MKKKLKKKTKVLIITFLCLIFAAGIVLAYFLFLSPNKIQTPLSKPTTANRFQVAQVAIFNEKYSSNYNGIYKYSRVNYVDFKGASNEEISAILTSFGVSDTMSLIAKFAKEKNQIVLANNEVLVIEDSRFQFNYGTQPHLLGSIYGNDDYCILYDLLNNKLFSASLTRLSQSQLESLPFGDENAYHGDEMFLTQTKSLTLDEANYSFDIIYVYKIQK